MTEESIYAAFIGGSKDGQMNRVYRSPFIEVPIFDNTVETFEYQNESVVPEPTVFIDRYRLETLATRHRKYELYVHTSLTVNDMIERLIANYIRDKND